MSLSLKITSYQRLTPSQQVLYRAESDSFTIGRNSENDWCIPDPQRFLSGVHCRIHSEGAKHFITDTSTNGVFLNGSEERMERNETVELQAGDKFRIGDYEFEVLIGEDSMEESETMSGADPFDDPFSLQDDSAHAQSHDEPDPFSDDDPFSEPHSPEAAETPEDDFQKDLNTPLAHLDESPLGTPVSINSLMDLDDDGPEGKKIESAENLEQSHSPLNEAFSPSGLGAEPEPNYPGAPSTVGGTPEIDPDEFPDNWDEATGMLRIPEQNEPAPEFDPLDIPDDWDITTGMHKAPLEPEPYEPPIPEPPVARSEVAPPEKPKQARASVAKPKTPAQSGDAVAAFARGAGLSLGDLSEIDQEVLFEQVGRMVIMFTEGLIQTLGGRTHIKSEFRLNQTMIRPAENNPFKFSTSKTRTLLQLLSKNDPAYMTGVNAISEGFDDVNAHQMAVIAGMEAALQDILGRFNPKTLEKRMISDSLLDNFLPGGKKAKYWDIFKLLFDEIAGEAEDNFQQLFGREFSRAYEEQLSRLKNTRKE